MSKISVIIPTYNEAEQIGEVVRAIYKNAKPEDLYEVIVADGGSSDGTIEIARQAGAQVFICSKKGRAIQMNAGARRAKGSVLYFLHGDTFPAQDFTRHIKQAVTNGRLWGCFRLQFDQAHWVLKTWGWFSRFPFLFIRFGDQSLYVDRSLFEQVKGFREDYLIMEDHEIVYRLRPHSRCKVIAVTVRSSAKKFKKNGTLRLFGIFILIFCLYKLRFSQGFLKKIYRKLILEGKI